CPTGRVTARAGCSRGRVGVGACRGVAVPSSIRERRGAGVTRTRLFTLLLAASITGCVAGGPDEAAPGHDDAHEHEQETPEGEAVPPWIGGRRPGAPSLPALPAGVAGAADSRARLDTPLRGSVVTITARVGDRVEAGDALIELRIPAV